MYDIIVSIFLWNTLSIWKPMLYLLEWWNQLQSYLSVWNTVALNENYETFFIFFVFKCQFFPLLFGLCGFAETQLSIAFIEFIEKYLGNVTSSEVKSHSVLLFISPSTILEKGLETSPLYSVTGLRYNHIASEFRKKFL